MSRAPFNDGWTVRPKVSVFAQLGGAGAPAQEVVLPHDALLAAHRSPEAPGKTAYFPASAAFEYSKTFFIPEEYRSKRVAVEFEGAHRDAMVFVNGTFAAQRPFGYSGFVVPLDDFLMYGSDNTIRVDVRAHDDSRWYTGVGILRDTALLVRDLVHIAPGTLVVTTPDVDAERAVVEVAARIVNAGTAARTVTVRTEIRDDDGTVVAAGTAPVTLRIGDTETARQRLYLRAPHRWDPDDPYLYSVTASVVDGEDELDTATAPLGVRTLQLDPTHGLRINGRSVKLRGACIHHDNGLLGGAGVARAEERRVELLKAAGFNALRSSHNPMSRAMLDACDRVGVLVMDEAFDIWTEGKSSFDYSLSFPEWWERDIEAMVAKDINHPSVVMYSIGNEIPETGTPFGAQIGRRLAEKVRSLDPTRFVTNAINGFVSVLPEVMKMRQEAPQPTPTASEGVNDFMNSAGAMMNRISASPLVTDKTAESFSVLDIGGINYGDERYAGEPALFPDRILVGSETFPSHIDVNWALVEAHPHVIGDFTWTGWDYLGEVGIGRLRYGDDKPEFEAPYPWRTAWSGDLDITGFRRPVSYYRETVFGLRHEPYIAVIRPQTHGRRAVLGGWSWPDAVSSWTWSAERGAPVTVEVYSDADEVELQVGGRIVGRAPAGREHAFRASFETTYEPGELMAVSYVDGEERARTALRTAGSLTGLTLTADRDEVSTRDGDLAYITIEITDGAGAPVPNADRAVEVTVSGDGVLVGLGSGRPDSDERFDASRATTFDGRLLAIVRPTGAGEIAVTAHADGAEAGRATVQVIETNGAHR